MSNPRILVLDSRCVSAAQVGVRDDVTSARPWAYVLGLTEDGHGDLCGCGAEASALLGAAVFPALRVRTSEVAVVRASLESDGFSIGQNLLVSGREPVLEELAHAFEEAKAAKRRQALRVRYGKDASAAPSPWIATLAEAFPAVPALPADVTLWCGTYNIFGHVCIVFPPDLDRFLGETLTALWASGLGARRESTAGILVD